MADDAPTRRVDPDDQPTVRGLSAGRTVFSRYTLEVVAGRGGMGVVWRARDGKLERLVALKFLPEAVAADHEAVRDLLRETRRCLDLTHSNIVRVHDLVQDDQLAAIAMEYVDGESLARRKAAAPAGCLSVEELAPLAAQLCAALDYAHRVAKVVHRDLKPANLLLTKDGQLKVTDFGIARSLSDTHTRLTGRVGNTSGTLLYMSPQQLVGSDPTAADDIYALGVTLYELLTGKPPFHSGDVTLQIREVAPQPVNARRAALGLPPLPPAWEETIAACLAKEPADRPQSAGEVAERLGLGETTKHTKDTKTEGRPGGSAGAAAVPPAARVGRVIRDAPDKRRTEDRPPDPQKSKLPFYTALAVALVLALGGWYYFGSIRPAQLQRAEQQRIKQEQAAAASQAEAEKEEQAQAAILARIDALVDGSAPEARQTAEEAVKAYLAGAPEKDRAAVQDRWTKRLAGWEAARLAAARGGLIVTTTPPGAEVAVGGFALDKSPLTLKDVKLGQYPVVIRLPGYEEVTRSAEVKENEFATLDVTLTRSTGTLNLTSVPAGLQVDVAERLSVPGGAGSGSATPTVTTPSALKLPTGDYTLTFHRPGWPDQQQSVTVARNETKPVLAEFVGGALDITSTPSGAEVYSQGRRLGTTPLSFRDLIPGSVDLEFHLKGYKTATTQGTVRAKDTAQVAVTLEKIRGPEEGQAWTIPDLGLVMQPIPAGTFMMGSPDSEQGRYPEEGPQTQVTLTKPFWLGRTEVTQAQWQALMGSNPSNFKGTDLPVEQVSWDDAMAFCRKLTERERAAGRLPEGYAYTLPTEAQWEYACRAGTTGPYAGDGNLDDMGWYSQNSGNTTHPAAQKQANAWGLYDMHGNVWEWCSDWYGNYPGGSVADYAGPTSGTNRVLRGGGWSFVARYCRSAIRDGDDPGYRDDDLGFRLALSSVR